MTDTHTTSGTTGAPRSFVITPEAIERRVAQLAHAKGPEFTQLASMFCMRAQGSTVARRYERYCETKGVKFFVTGGNRFDDAQIIKANKVEGLVGTTADQALDLKRRLKGYKFKYIEIGGAPSTVEQLKRVRDLMVDLPSGQGYVSYGISPFGPIALATLTQGIAIPGCVGKVNSDVNLRIEEGEVVVEVQKHHGATEKFDARTPSDTRFWRDPKDGKLWMYTGDLGELKLGMLILKGRK